MLFEVTAELLSHSNTTDTERVVWFPNKPIKAESVFIAYKNHTYSTNVPLVWFPNSLWIVFKKNSESKTHELEQCSLINVTVQMNPFAS